MVQFGDSRDMGVKVNLNQDSGMGGGSFNEARDMRSVKNIELSNLDWSGATTVKGIGYRFILPVPNLGTDNETVTVKNWKGEEQQIIGMSFRNSTDSAIQAVSGDGKGVLVLAIDPEKIDRDKFSQSLMKKVAELGGVENLKKSDLQNIIGMIPDLLKAAAHDPNSVPKADVYNSDDSLASSMVPQSGLTASGNRPFGLYEKSDKPGPLAMFIEGNCSVTGGPHASAASFENGFMAVQIPAKNEGHEPSYRTVAPEAVSYCYVLADGSPIKTADLKQG
jgi:hypothetical protein